jgi:type IV pilus assembly protein PilC
MAVFAYQGTNRAGTVVKGEQMATTKAEATNILRRQQINVTKISEKGKEFTMPTFGGSVSAKELAIFTRQFSVMIDAGLPLVQCLELIANQQDNKHFQKILHSVRSSVEGGQTLSAAMRPHVKVFDTLYVNMIEAGETGGILDTILQRLSAYIEKNVKLKAAVKSALIYPVSVISIAVLVVVGLLWKVVPIFGKLFEGLGVALPTPTKIVINLSNFIGSIYGLMIVVIFVGIGFALNVWYKTPVGRRAIDAAMLKIPIIGMILRKIAVARFTRTLGTLISSGVPILEGLDITARTSGNAVVEEALMKVRSAVEGGRNLQDPLKETEIFPNMVTQMVGVGEQTGAMDAMLSKVADFYEDEVDAAIKNMLTLLEPLMIAFLGVAVGGIVISLYLPLFELIGKLAG